MDIIEKLYRYCQIAKPAGEMLKDMGYTFNGVPYICRSQFIGSGTTCQGNILTRTDIAGKIVVCFRGSTTTEDWIHDAFVWKKKWPFSNQSHRLDKVKIHSGFDEYWSSVRVKVIRELNDLVKLTGGVKPEIVFCGHSLGGALTSLAVLDVSDSLGNVADYASYTFASPRVYNPDGRARFNEIVKYANRLTYSRDLVPQVPVINYDHVGRGMHVTPSFDFTIEEFEKPFFTCTPFDHFVDLYINALRFIYESPERRNQANALFAPLAPEDK